MRKPLFLAALPILIIILGCSFYDAGASWGASIPADSILARVNDETITVAKFYDHLRKSRITSKNSEEDQKKKQEALHELIREMLINQKAASLDMELDTVYVIKRDQHMLGWLLDYMYQIDIKSSVEVSDQEVKDHYEKNREKEFLIPAEAKVRDLLIPVYADSTGADYHKKLKKADKEAKEKIRELHKRAVRGEDFVDLCRQYTHAPVPDRTGKREFIKKGQESEEFDEAMFSLQEIGEISEPFRDHLGYHIVQLLDRKEESYHELDSLLVEGIRGYLKNEKVKEASVIFVDSLKGSVQFVYNWDVLNSSLSPANENIWVLAFGEGDTIGYKEYENMLSVYMFQMGSDSVNLEEKKYLLENNLAFPIILRREAEKRGYADLVEYHAEKRAFTLEEAERKFKATRIKKDFPPATREELEKYYREHKIDLPPLGVPIHVYHIIFEDSLKAAKVLDQIRGGEDFVSMAKLYFPGEPEMKEVAYDLGFITQGEMPDGFYRAALNLQVGDVSEPVKTKWGYHLIQVVQREEKGNAFEDIVPIIQRGIDLEKSRQYIADWEEALFNEGELWIDEKLLKELKLPKPEG
jgi:parvulin-like peptidyl-prolyl isomerase